MANVDAFNTGFDMGMKKASGKDPKKKGKAAPGGAAKGTHIGDDIQSFKNGGRVRKTGVYRLHKGEEVIPAKRANKRGRAKARKKSMPKR